MPNQYEPSRGEARSAGGGDAGRARLLARVERLASKKPPRGLVPEATIRSMERLAREVEEAHEPEVYDGLPRLMLVYPTMWLLEAYKGRKNHAKVAATALRVLRNFGFPIEGEGDVGVGSIFRGHRGDGMPSVLTIHVLTSLAQGCGACPRVDGQARSGEPVRRGGEVRLHDVDWV